MATKQTSRKLPPEILTRAEILSLMAACGRRSPTGIRNRALLAVIYRSMLRISEALDLHPKDYDPSASTLRVLHGKGDKARTVGIDADAAAHLERWLEERRRLSPPRSATLFCTLKGGRVSGSYVRHLLPRLARKAGVEKRVHAHGLRHTGASELRSEGVDIGVISKQLGHSSIAVTARYLDHIAPASVIEAITDRPSWTSSHP